MDNHPHIHPFSFCYGQQLDEKRYRICTQKNRRSFCCFVLFCFSFFAFQLHLSLLFSHPDPRCTTFCLSRSLNSGAPVKCICKGDNTIGNRSIFSFMPFVSLRCLITTRSFHWCWEKPHDELDGLCSPSANVNDTVQRIEREQLHYCSLSLIWQCHRRIEDWY